MTIEATPAAVAAPPIVPPVVAPAAPPVITASAPAAGESEVRMSSAVLKERLAEERAKGEKAVATALGVSVEDAKKIIADAKQKDDAQKSEVQRLTEQNSAKDLKLAEFEAYKGAVVVRAASELAGLTEAQRASVLKIAGESPAAQLVTIEAMRPTWNEAAKQASDAAAQAKAIDDAKAAAEAAAIVAKANAPSPKVPAPAGTAPAAGAPPQAQPGAATNHLATYEALKAGNPAVAARYHSQHAAAILAAQRQKTTG